eukprot:3141191-Rhodomonas_salina.5
MVGFGCARCKADGRVWVLAGKPGQAKKTTATKAEAVDIYLWDARKGVFSLDWSLSVRGEVSLESYV